MHSGRPFEFLFPISALFLLSSTTNTTTAAAASSSMEQLFRGRGRVIPRWMRTGWSERRSPHPHPHPHLFIGVDRIIVHFSSDFSCRRQSTPTAKSTPKSTNFRFLNRSKFGDSSPNFRLFSSSAEFFFILFNFEFQSFEGFHQFWWIFGLFLPQFEDLFQFMSICRVFWIGLNLGLWFLAFASKFGDFANFFLEMSKFLAAALEISSKFVGSSFQISIFQFSFPVFRDSSKFQMPVSKFFPQFLQYFVANFSNCVNSLLPTLPVIPISRGRFFRLIQYLVTSLVRSSSPMQQKSWSILASRVIPAN